jgi:hypothetical protein
MCPAEAAGGGAHVSRTRMAVAWHRTRLALALYAPLSPTRLSALDFCPRFRTGPPLSRFFIVGVSLARLLAQRTSTPPPHRLCSQCAVPPPPSTGL